MKDSFVLGGVGALAPRKPQFVQEIDEVSGILRIELQIVLKRGPVLRRLYGEREEHVFKRGVGTCRARDRTRWKRRTLAGE